MNDEKLNWDLTSRLRRIAQVFGDALHVEAADRIEELERQLASRNEISSANAKMADDMEANPHSFAFLYEPNFKAIIAALRAAPQPLTRATEGCSGSSGVRGEDVADAAPLLRGVESLLIRCLRHGLLRAETEEMIKAIQTALLPPTPRTDAHLSHLNTPGGQKIGIPDVTLELMRNLEREAVYYRNKWVRVEGELADARNPNARRAE